MFKEITIKKPLVHCITNPISINQCANTILSVGARPVMAEHPREVCEITKTADSLLLNLGNITDARIRSMKISAKTANKKGIPITLDLVGVGCSKLRLNFSHKLTKKYRPAVIKGNYSEIYALYNPDYKVSGVDAQNSIDVKTISEVSQVLSRKYNTIILASGMVDVVADGEKVAYIKNGTVELSQVTGTGCMLGALCTAFTTVLPPFEASVSACAVLGVCGEIAKTDKGNGSFLVGLLDALSTISYEEINKRKEVYYEKI